MKSSARSLAAPGAGRGRWRAGTAIFTRSTQFLSLMQTLPFLCSQARRLAAGFAMLATSITPAPAQTPAPLAPIPGLPFWEWQINRPTGYQLLALHTFNDSTLIAVGGHGTAVKTANNGRTWQVLPTGIDREIQSVSFADNLTGWLGYETSPLTPLHSYCGPGQVLRTTDGGQRWTTQPIGDNRTVTLPTVVAVSSTEAYLAYYYGGTTGSPNYFPLLQEPAFRHTTDGGQTWPLLPLPRLQLGVYFYNVVFPTPAVGYVATGSRDRGLGYCYLQRTADHGQTWQDVAPTLTNGGIADFQPSSISFLDAQRGWVAGVVAGNGPGSNTGLALFRTANGGQNWTQLATPPGLTTSYFALTMADATHGIISLSYVNYLTTDGGLTWSAPVAVPPSLNFNRVTGLRSSGAGWSVGTTGSLYSTANYGQTWRSRATPEPVSSLNALAFSDPVHGWALPTSDEQDARTVLRTTRRGAPWQVLPPPGLRVPLPRLQAPAYTLTDGAFPDADTAWVVGHVVDTVTNRYTGLVLHTTDGGGHWTRQPLASAALYLRSVAAWDTRRAIALDFDYGVHAGGLFVTRNGGRQWSARFSPAPRRQLYRATWADSATVYVTTDSTILLKSTTAGRTWQQLPGPGRGDFYPYPNNRLCFTSANVGYCINNGDRIWKTTDGARTWIEYDVSSLGTSWPALYGRRTNPDIQNFSFRNARVGWAFGTNDILKTTNAGQTWQHVAYVGAQGGVPCGRGPNVLLDDYNAYGAGSGLSHYSEKFVQADTLAAQPRRYCPGQVLTLAYATEGTLTAAERANLRLQLSNPMGRFRKGQTWLLAPAPGGTATALAATLPAALPAGTHYRLRVITADSALLGGDNGRDLAIAPLPTASISPAGPALAVCQGATATLSAPAGQAQYLWSTGATTRTITVSTAGSYTVQVAGAAGCLGPPSPAVAVAVDALPAAPVLARNAGTGQLAVAVPLAGATYAWTFDGNPLPSVSGPLYPATGAGAAPAGTYTATATSAAGCASAASAPLVVVLAVRAATAAELRLYPNPAREVLVLERPAGEPTATATLLDALGRAVLMAPAPAGRTVLDVRALPEGLYVLRLSRPDGWQRVRSVQVRR